MTDFLYALGGCALALVVIGLSMWVTGLIVGILDKRGDE